MKSFNTIYVWIGASGGDWFDNVHNWTPGYPVASPPGYGDLVIFNNGVAETVVGNGAASEIDVVLGTTLTIKDSMSGDGAVSGVGLMVDSGGTVIVASGATKTGVPSAPGDVSVDVIGFNAAGTLDVRAGGGLDDTGMVLGDRSDGSGTLMVEGIAIVAPAAAPNGLLIVGNAGTGVVTVQNGGALSALVGTVLGLQSGSNGTATLTGAGSTWLAGALTVGSAGTGSVTVQDGGALTTTNTSFIGLDDAASGVHGTGSVTIETGGTLTALTSLGIGSLGTFLVDDGTVSANAITVSGGSMEVSNGGSVTTQTVTLAGGTINVLKGRELVDGGAAIAGTAGSVLREPGVNFDALGSIGQLPLSGALLATGSFTQMGGVNTVSGGGAKLEVGATGSGSYNLILGQLTAPREMIGETGHGSFIQTGGINTMTTGLLSIGTNVGGIGTYSLANGSLIALHEVVGGAGTGTFVQHSGSNDVAGVNSTLEVGVSGLGTYRLILGTLTATRESIGETGTGSFVQTGGANTLTAGLLDLGTKTGGTGSYSLSLGKIIALGEVVGDAGTGSFHQAGGTNTLSGDLVIGKAAGGMGSYDLTGGSLTIKDATGTSHTLSLGLNATATGEMTIAAAKVSTPFLHLGHGNLTVEAGGVLRVLHQVQIDTGSTLDATNGAMVIGKVVTPVADLIIVGATGVLEGAGTMTGNLRDGLTGTVRAQGGTLTLTGDLSGSGKLQIADGGILDLRGIDPLGINFLGAAGVLRIEKTAAVSGRIGHLAVGDVIDLAGVTATHTGLVGGNLTVTESNGSKLILHVAGALASNHFAISSDGAGGSNLTLTALALISDHFAFGPSNSFAESTQLTGGHSLGIEAFAAAELPVPANADFFAFENWDHADQINSLIEEGLHF